MVKTMAHKSALLLLPTLSPTLDIVISLGLDLLINFFEELRILDVTLIIFFKAALDFSKIVLNPNKLVNVKCAKPIDQRPAFLYNFAMHILEWAEGWVDGGMGGWRDGWMGGFKSWFH
jgi:hypothetical protein